MFCSEEELMKAHSCLDSFSLGGSIPLCACMQRELCTLSTCTSVFHPMHFAQVRAYKPVVWSQLWTGHATDSVTAP